MMCDQTGAVDNTVTALLRSTRPVTPGASVTMAAPEGQGFREYFMPLVAYPVADV